MLFPWAAFSAAVARKSTIMLFCGVGTSAELGRQAREILRSSTMPKRTNEFQRLIVVIYSAMAGVEGGEVTESALLQEPDGTPREIDILIEAPICGHTIRIAVECRDRSRKSDIQWIDELLGKYRNLNVNKVIAVSREGFSPAAEAKAQAGGIELRLLQQCVDTDWPTEFVKLGIGQFSISPRFQSASFELAPPPQSEVTLQSTVENRQGCQLGSVQDILLDCYIRSVVPRIKNFISAEFLPSCRVLADLEKKIELTIPIDISELLICGNHGSKYGLNKITYVVAMRGEFVASEVNTFRYDKNCLSTAMMKSAEAIHKVSIVQVAGSRQLSVNVAETSSSLSFPRSRTRQRTARRLGGT